MGDSHCHFDHSLFSTRKSTKRSLKLVALNLLLQLFGHEIVAMLCGIVWGLGIGFLIVAAGTILGELANL